METVSDHYKLGFNTGYLLSQTDGTTKLVEKLIEKSDPEFREALIAGVKQREKEVERHYHSHLTDEYVKEGAAMTKGEPRRELTEKEDAERIRLILEQGKNQKGQFIPSDRVGEGPALSPQQAKEVSDFEAQQRAKGITREAKEAGQRLEREKPQEPQKMFDPMTRQPPEDRQATIDRHLREQQERDKDRGRD